MVKENHPGPIYDFFNKKKLKPLEHAAVIAVTLFAIVSMVLMAVTGKESFFGGIIMLFCSIFGIFMVKEQIQYKVSYIQRPVLDIRFFYFAKKQHPWSWYVTIIIQAIVVFAGLVFSILAILGLL
jgi:hypothetical protein